jgi:hypothetical protein
MYISHDPEEQKEVFRKVCDIVISVHFPVPGHTVPFCLPTIVTDGIDEVFARPACLVKMIGKSCA